MAHLDPQVQVRLIEISKEWAVETANKNSPSPMPSRYPEEFDKVYKKLEKTVSEAMFGEKT